jgi:flagellar basal-body rod modification protein FlgD
MISSVSTKSMYSPLFDTKAAGSTTGAATGAGASTGAGTAGGTDVPGTGAVGPAAPSTGSPSTPLSNALNKNDFMKLLVAQLKNQDPLNPMDGKDMAAQLAQFSSVEQLMTINTSITAQADAQKKMVEALTALQKGQTAQSDSLSSLIEGQMAVATVGKTGVTTGNTLFVDRDGAGSVTIDTGTVHGAGTMTVTDSTGTVVGEAHVANVKAGMQSIDLRDMAFKPPLTAGSYHYDFRVSSGGAAPLPVKTFTTGRITGLRYENGSPVLMLGDTLSVPFSQLVQVRG